MTPNWHDVGNYDKKIKVSPKLAKAVVAFNGLCLLILTILACGCQHSTSYYYKDGLIVAKNRVSSYLMDSSVHQIDSQTIVTSNGYVRLIGVNQLINQVNEEAVREVANASVKPFEFALQALARSYGL